MTKAGFTSPFPSKGAKELREEVLDQGLCTACGMCLDLCPYLDEMGENVAMISDCRGDQGRCYAVCPRTETDLDGLRERFFQGWSEEAADYVIGPHQAIWMARSRDASARQKGQYGGTVTALVLYGLESGQIDAALLSQWASDPEEQLLPRPVAAKSRDEVLAAAGSKYTACPTLKILDKTLQEEAERLCVVGRPCQVLALRKRMWMEDTSFPADRISLVMGLFCMWSLSYREFRKWLEPALGKSRIDKIDIPKGRFVVETEQGRVDLPHDDLLAHTRKTCQWCYDFTAELADLSIGSTEWKDDWNTLIVRTDAGRSYVKAAVKQGWIEVEPFPAERERLLREAAFNKKKRVLEKLDEERSKNGKDPYLKISKKEADSFSSVTQAPDG